MKKCFPQPGQGSQVQTMWVDTILSLSYQDAHHPCKSLEDHLGDIEKVKQTAWRAFGGNWPIGLRSDGGQNDKS